MGKQRSNAVLGRRQLPPVVNTPSASPGIIEHLEDVERGYEPDEMAELLSRLDEFRERHSVEVTGQTQMLRRIETSLQSNLKSVDERLLPIAAIIGKLEGLDHRVEALGGALPRPPSAARLAAAIVAVLVLGAASGLAMTHWQAESVTIVSPKMK